MADERDNDEFKNAVRHIGCVGTRLENPYDRVRVAEWVRRLAQLESNNLEESKKRNEYVQLLRIQAVHGFLKAPFIKPPPDTDLPPLSEVLGNIMSNRIPQLPKGGAIAPIISHQSPDGKAFLSIKKIPGSGIFCYMAVTPDTFPGKID